MTDWQPIETAPKDGSVVWVKRVYEGDLIAEGEAVWGVADVRAPMRQSLGVDPLGRLSATDYEREAREAKSYADTARWLRPDRLYIFPKPTHWKPLPQPVFQP